MEVKFPYLEFPYPGMKVIEAMPEDKVRLMKTHLPSHLLPASIDESRAKVMKHYLHCSFYVIMLSFDFPRQVIYIYRNPKDVAVSYYHFAKMLTYIQFQGSFDHFLRMFLSERGIYRFLKLFACTLSATFLKSFF